MLNSDPSEAKAVPLFVNLQKIRIWTAFDELNRVEVQFYLQPPFN
ncbi:MULTISPECIES: hypothetical protein [unclassified Empedobacter]|nr:MULTISPECIES: hypothetical protein [unclassified Empedobacter]